MDRAGLLFMIVTQGSFQISSMSSQNFLDLKKIFKKDLESQIYSNTMYFLASTFYIYPIYLIVQIVTLIMYYYITDLNKESSELFGWFFGFNIIGGFITGSILGILIGTIVDEKKHIGAIVPIVVLPFLIVSGFFQGIKLMAWPLRILGFVSTYKYTLQGLIINEF